ncbi:hypothetical protein [Caulobacter endophyticus]|uniref:hypothetical protein n=1 Tax=Caulobacter endophyticus TaxID=2172652 RepID=UPI00240EC7E9|nr:hypothetical protein [Caulobacter endophyticus]MDG2527885.1 hypothetical protein [Caulobacter endophyticus]
MSTSPITIKVLKAGLLRVDAETGAVLKVVPLQYNPDTVTRSFQPRGSAGDGDRVEALRLTGPPVETVTLEAELDATDALEEATARDEVLASGLGAQLAVLETMLYPSLTALREANAQASLGMIEVLPAPQPLTVFVWSRHRVTPVRITDLSVTEEAFDPKLNPIRAKISLTLRILSVDDLGFAGRGGGLYLAYQQQKETLAGLGAAGTLQDLGLDALP